MNEPEKQENVYNSLQPTDSLLRLNIRRNLSPDFNFNVDSQHNTDDIT
jgi:hypothetical protein